jgi:ABC-type branched-subunit amino acid transport system substrate-binding protein
MFIKLLCLSLLATPAFAEVGVSDSEIKTGSTSVINGSAAFLGIQYLQGFKVAIENANDNGGVNGRKITLIHYDDQYEPSPCRVNTQKLINEDKVFALANYVGTPTSVEAQPIWQEANVPILGFFTGAKGLRDPFNKNNFHVRASYAAETKAAIDYFVKHGKKKIAIFYQNDKFGEAVKAASEKALTANNITPVAFGTFERNTMAIEAGLATIKVAAPDAIVMVGTYAPLAKFVQESRKAGLNQTAFYTVSFVGPEALVTNLKNETQNVYVSQVMPVIYNSSSSFVKEYTESLKKKFPKDRPNFVSFEGYANGRVLIEGLKKSDKNLTRATFIKSLESLNLDLGELKLAYGANDHEGLDKVVLTKIENNQYIAVE